MKNYELNQDLYINSAEKMKVLGHPVRFGLVKMLVDQGPSNVTDLHEEFQLPQPAISQHLTKLKSNQIVRGTRKGLEVYYEVIDEQAKNIVQFFS
ncbi:ArsR/SmtB family transcription factor [Ectobacillus ponti]|uniref:Metalloregulator ArsR/SmtB family transcription factor n=1 Tax=Ectobacillus ponti TaxID=2961894 RepID=A0AA41XE62_9BACI|nr:metalloregulator ArsR/SmtB family transcription factor [Ectobacillus ponti]MCP8971258.1 metalloregulator ArsR/SmtB family transcription factor [Ectobacillus ponti]